MPRLEAESFAVALCDPPYGINFSSTRPAKERRRSSIANDKRPFVWFLPGVYRLLKSPGALFCFCSWHHAEVFREAIELAGFVVRSQLIWDRGIHGMADLKTCFAPRHDIIWYATKGRVELQGKRLPSVLCYPRPGVRSHPNEKPVELIEALLGTVAGPGDQVLSPFMGTGSDLLAVTHLGMSGIGIELDEAYYRLARERLNDNT